jgi:hypothetical protein
VVLRELAVGEHVFAVRATDAAGNTDPSPAQWRWSVTAPDGCASSSVVTVDAVADTWLLQSSPDSNYGSDGTAKVDTKSTANARALVRFRLPDAPNQCRVVNAELRLYASSSKPDRTLEVVRVADNWSESTATWANQPPVVGAAARAASGDDWRHWDVGPQVRGMYAKGNFGFLIRDHMENGVGVEQQFHTREKSPDNPPQLVVTFE